MKRLFASLGLFAALAAAPAGIANAAAPDERARVNYILQCQGCHLANGSGRPGAVPDFRVYMAKFLQVEGGREYIARVPGIANAPLTPSQLAAVLNWIYDNLPVGDLPSDYRRFSADEMAKYSREPLIEVLQERQRLIQIINAPIINASQ